MIESDLQRTSRPWGMGKPASSFAVLALGLLVAVIGAAEALFGAVVVPALVFTLVAALGLRALLQSYPHTSLGACNVITLGRIALVSVLAGAILVPVSAWVVFVIAVVAFVTDGIDGWLARRFGLVSAFGARFDMEADAMLAATLSLVILSAGTAGPAILVLGFARYIFVLAGFIWPALTKDLPESLRRKAICVVQIAALIILVFPLTPVWALTPIAVGAAVLLLYSFAIDIRHLMRTAA